MRNLADAIENFIINELLRDSADTLLVQRNELAEKLSCAPSQISYVLGTRFTPERGFIVESRRGSGGFVRIVKVSSEENLLQGHEISAKELLRQFAMRNMITGREEKLLQYMLNILDADESKKKAVLYKAIEQIRDNR